MKAVSEELDVLKTSFRSALEIYAARLENEIEQVRTTVLAETKRKKIPPAKLRDLRDLLTLLRKSPINPEKGRRKDIKKIDTLVGDLTLLIENW